MKHTNGLLVDIETVPLERALDWVEPAGNLVDPVKKAASVREKQDKLALDPNGCRIVALGIWRLEHGVWSDEPTVEVAQTLDDEARLLSAWLDDDKYFGFNIRGFDCPVMMRRAQILRVPFPAISLARYGRGDVVDLFDELTWHEGHHCAGGAVSRSLDSFARVFDLPEMDNPGGGELVSVWAKDGRFDLIAQHCTADLYREAHLGARLNLWADPPMPPAIVREVPDLHAVGA
jgi:hypothetical protein